MEKHETILLEKISDFQLHLDKLQELYDNLRKALEHQCVLLRDALKFYKRWVKVSFIAFIVCLLYLILGLYNSLFLHKVAVDNINNTLLLIGGMSNSFVMFLCLSGIKETIKYIRENHESRKTLIKQRIFTNIQRRHLR